MVHPLKVYRPALPTRPFARLSAVFVCGVTALLVTSAVPAFAAESVTYKPEGIHEHELIALNWGGDIESEPEFSEPPGYYVEHAVEGKRVEAGVERRRTVRPE